MPSIFNHDNNACWGIRRTSYSIFNEPMLDFDVNVDKTEISNTSVVNQTMNKIDNFHGSSNGYYGYHIPTTDTNDNAMDTSNGINLVTNRQFSQNNHTSGQCQNEEFWRRKRSYPREQHDSCKRFKKEGPAVPADETPAAIQDLTFEEDTRVLRKRNNEMEDELEFLDNYLKQTHGCDFYNYNQYEDF